MNQAEVLQFLFVTIILGGAAAFASGRAAARAWSGIGATCLHVVLLAGAVRFIHFALFQGPLLSLQHFALEVGVLLFFAFLGRRITRARQMTTQYDFIFERRGLLRWAARAAVVGAGGDAPQPRDISPQSSPKVPE